MPTSNKKNTSTARRTQKNPLNDEQTIPTSTVSSVKFSAKEDLGFAKKILLTLTGILLAYLIIYIGTLIRNNIQAYDYIGEADRHERIISLEAVGTAIAKPDIAITSMGVFVEAETVAEAQEKNSQVLNSLITRLKDMEIAKEDIKTENYNIYPRFDYSEEGRVLKGYEVSQQVSVKLRKVDSASEVLALAGEFGITNVNGLTFTIDDTDVYIEEARRDAMQKLRTKINDITTQLGIKVVEIVSYDEYPEGNNNNLYASVTEKAYDLGNTPMIESGLNEIKLRVRVNLEIK